MGVLSHRFVIPSKMIRDDSFPCKIWTYLALSMAGVDSTAGNMCKVRVMSNKCQQREYQMKTNTQHAVSVVPPSNTIHRLSAAACGLLTSTHVPETPDYIWVHCAGHICVLKKGQPSVYELAPNTKLNWCAGTLRQPTSDSDRTPPGHPLSDVDTTQLQSEKKTSNRSTEKTCVCSHMQ